MTTIRAGFIGINRHIDPAIDELTGAVRDATAFYTLFQDTIPDASTSLLTDHDATITGVRTLLDDLFHAAGEDDVVILVFSGHGTHNHRLVTHDTRLDDLGATSIAMTELADLYRKSRARNVLVVLDCCFSGAAPARVIEDGLTMRGAALDLHALFAGPGRVLVAASAVDQPAWERDGHGLLTRALLDSILASAQAVDVAALMTNVIAHVAIESARLGVTQTPCWTGNFTGAFVLPLLRPGANFAAAFPSPETSIVGRNLHELAILGLPGEVLDLWGQAFPGGLNDLQLAAINSHGLLEGKSLLVVAPTSSGKTFVGELAALRAAATGRRTVFLLPYKALVNEKYDQFTDLYSERLGLRVVRCTGDFQDQTNAFTRGRYDIALLTYETFLNLVVGNPSVLSRIGVVVLDEAQFITDPNRGINVELLLTFLLAAREQGVSPQLIALSAVIGNTNGFEKWLGCEALVIHERPVPLVEGVLGRSGRFTYVDVDGERRQEQLLPPGSVVQRRREPSAQDVIVPLARHLFATNPTEKLIVFRNIRGKAEGAANYLAEELGLPPATDALAALPEQDLSTTSQRLRDCLRGGTAFHNSNLSREEREVVERAFRARDGQVRVLGATTTVAAGINTPASTVVLAETEFVGDDGRPFTIAEYKNMVGRAGRLGFNEKGRAILVADNPLHEETLLRKYILGTLEDLRSSFTGDDLHTWVLRLLAQARRVARDDVSRLLANTYAGFTHARSDPTWRARLDSQLERVLAGLEQLELVNVEGDVVRLSMLGYECGRSSLTFDSARRLINTVRLLPPETLTLPVLLAVTQALPQMDATYTPLFKKGHLEKTWPGIVARRYGDRVHAILGRSLDDPLDVLRRNKRVLLVHDWIEGAPVEQMERTYTNNPNSGRIGYGDVRRVVDATRMHFRSVVPIAAVLVPSMPHDDDAVDILLRRLEVGLPEVALGLADEPALQRGEMLALSAAGIVTTDTLWRLPRDELEGLLGEIRAAVLDIHRPS